MDPRLLNLYAQELIHVRDMAADFAARYPKIAGRLGLDSPEVQDPHIERLLEGFAFLTARTQLKLQEEYPEFTAQLLARVVPGAVCPVPAMGVVKLSLNLADPALKQGLEIPQGSRLLGQPGKAQQTPCTFTTAHALRLWPIELSQLAHGPCAVQGRGRSAISLRLSLTQTLSWGDLKGLDHLDFHVGGPSALAFSWVDRFSTQAVGVAIRTEGSSTWCLAPELTLEFPGFANHEALLPQWPTTFSGLRLLQEFMVCPERFLFIRLRGLAACLGRMGRAPVELAIVFHDRRADLDTVVAEDTLLLHCTPVVNLFSHRCDRVPLDDTQTAFHLIPNRTRPLDFEVHSVQEVNLHAPDGVTPVLPLYGSPQQSRQEGAVARYSVDRRLTVMSDRAQRDGHRSGHVGTESYLCLSRTASELLGQHPLANLEQGKSTLMRQALQLEVQALCSNRDLPMLMPVGVGNTDLHDTLGLPITQIRFLRGPSRPRPAPAQGRSAWQLIEHLTVHYAGLFEQAGQDHTTALAQLLSLMADPANASEQALLAAVLAVRVKAGVAQQIIQGRPAVVRGLRVHIELDEQALAGLGMTVFGRVLGAFLSRHVSLHSWVAITLLGRQSGQVLTLPPTVGQRPLC